MTIFYVGDQELEALKEALEKKIRYYEEAVKHNEEATKRIENDHATNARVKALESKRVRHVQTIARLRKTLAGAMKGIWRLRQRAEKAEKLTERLKKPSWNSELAYLRVRVRELEDFLKTQRDLHLKDRGALEAEVERLKEYELMYRRLSK